MKNSNIKAINTAGTVGYVISILLIICTIAGMVGTAIGTAAAASVAKDEVSVRVSSNIDVSATGNILETLNKFMSVDGVDNLNDLVGESNGAEVAVADDDLSYISVDKTEEGLKINARTKEAVYSIKKIIVSLIAFFVFLGAVTAALYMLKALMKSLKTCETPFNEDVIKKMKRFAISLIPAVALNIIFDGLWSSLSVGADFSPSLNIGSILLVAVVYVLVFIFEYGAKLQQESDETL